MQAGSGFQRDPSILEGALERITYANAETGYTIARIDPGRGPDLVTAVAPLLGAQVGESLRMRGRWTSHPKCGKQFGVFSCTTVLPATVQGIQRYLGSGLIKGIGPVMVFLQGAGVSTSLAVRIYKSSAMSQLMSSGPSHTGLRLTYGVSASRPQCIPRLTTGCGWPARHRSGDRASIANQQDRYEDCDPASAGFRRKYFRGGSS
jgi:hypothetical protein